MLFSLIIHYNYASVLNAIRLSHRKRHKSEFPPTKSSAFPQLQRAGSTRRGAGGQPEPAQYRSRPAGLLSPRPPSAARQPNATSRGRSVPAERGDGTGRDGRRPGTPLTPRMGESARDMPTWNGGSPPAARSWKGPGLSCQSAEGTPAATRSSGAAGTLRRHPGHQEWGGRSFAPDR